jgi:hypothetical protein
MYLLQMGMNVVGGSDEPSKKRRVTIPFGTAFEAAQQ